MSSAKGRHVPQQASNGEIKVRLGVLAHADVGLPGRRLVWQRARGWVPMPAPRRWWGVRTSHLGLGAGGGVVVALALAAAWALRSTALQAPDAAVDRAAEVAASPSAPTAGPLQVAAVSTAPGVRLNADPPEPGSSVASGVRIAAERSAEPSGGPRPEWASGAAAAVGAGPVVLHAVVPPAGTARPPGAGASEAPVRTPRQPSRATVSRPAGSDRDGVTIADARPAEAGRRMVPNAPGQGEGRVVARPAASSAPASQAIFNDTAVPTNARADVLVAITNASTIVVPDTRGLPATFRVGERLPSGARLLKVDPRGGEADTDRGVIRLE